jgi:hypothetical protein
MQAEIRTSSVDKFPLRERFEELKSSGSLTGAKDAARRLVDYLLRVEFGKAAVADLREV